ncbi:hypothetical protein ACP70R_021155 [Stipagrostis hirtigluma subsp. patula]
MCAARHKIRTSLHQRCEPPPAKRCRGGGGGRLPDDMVFQVLLRLPVRSLLRFRSVCTSWYATITSPYFVRRHAELSSAAAGASSMLILPRQRLPWPLRMRGVGLYLYPGRGAVAELMHERFWSTGVVPWMPPAHLDGLVVIPSYDSQIFVCNPATREFAALPRGGAPDCLGYQKVGFGLDPSSGRYKVVRCYLRDYDYVTLTATSVGCEVFTLGGGGGWRPAADPPCTIKAQTAVCLPSGAMYWPAILSAHEVGIVRFGLTDEEFAMFPSPPCMDPLDWGDCLAGLDGELCYGRHSTPATFELWKATGDGEWSLWHKFAMPQPPGRGVSPIAAHDGSIFLCLDGSLICRHDTKTGTLELVVDMQKDLCFHHAQEGLYFRIGGWAWSHTVIQYAESLISIKAGTMQENIHQGRKKDSRSQY